MSCLNNPIVTPKTIKNLLLHVVFPVFFGGLIYVGFRQESINLFVLLQKTIFYEPILFIRNGLSVYKDNLSSIILFSLPDGIWVYSCTYMILTIWQGSVKNTHVFLWVIAPVLISIIIECLQSINIVQGTFCIYDMTFYIIGFLMAISAFRRSNGKSKSIC